MSTTSDQEQSIRDLAYQLWLDEGCPDNRAMEFWLQAEAALTVTSPPVTAAAPPKVESTPAPKPKAESVAKPKAAAAKSKVATAAKPKAAGTGKPRAAAKSKAPPQPE